MLAGTDTDTTVPGARRRPRRLALVAPTIAAALVTASFAVALPAHAAPSAVACDCTHTLFGQTAPAVADSGAGGPEVELGVKFTTDSSGWVTGVRFYKSAANTGTHTGSLWSSTGTLLATATFTHERATGWQQVRFFPAVAVTAGLTYIASYHTTVGHYAATQGAFASAFDNPPLHVPASNMSGGNGVFAYGPSSFPNQGFEESNYWVDVTFSTCRPEADDDGHGGVRHGHDGHDGPTGGHGDDGSTGGRDRHH